jgi:hypothetical protein
MTVLALGSYQECEDAFILAADKIVVDRRAVPSPRALRDVSADGRITEQDRRR